jgi:hypothetical protein
MPRLKRDHLMKPQLFAALFVVLIFEVCQSRVFGQQCVSAQFASARTSGWVLNDCFTPFKSDPNLFYLQMTIEETGSDDDAGPGGFFETGTYSATVVLTNFIGGPSLITNDIGGINLDISSGDGSLTATSEVCYVDAPQGDGYAGVVKGFVDNSYNIIYYGGPSYVSGYPFRYVIGWQETWYPSGYPPEVLDLYEPGWAMPFLWTNVNITITTNSSLSIEANWPNVFDWIATATNSCLDGFCFCTNAGTYSFNDNFTWSWTLSQPVGPQAYANYMATLPPVLPLYTNTWSVGGATLVGGQTIQLSPGSLCGFATNMEYCIEVAPPTVKNVDYKLQWLEVTKNTTTGVVSSTIQTGDVIGTGDPVNPAVGAVRTKLVSSLPLNTLVWEQDLTFQGMNGPSGPPGTGGK